MISKKLITIALCFFLFAGCVATPETDRSAMILVPFSQEVALGDQAYKEILGKEKLSTNSRLAAIVRRVGERLAKTTTMPDLKWEFNLVESDQQNAFALPGGKVAIYTGILPMCKNEAGLAAVMGHEIAHAIARHGARRMSQQMVLQGGMSLASASLANAASHDMIMGALGLGANYGVVLPYSRDNESEADEIGLTYMARAGYEPKEAAQFWTRFSQAKGGGQPPEILSTHPADATRISNINKLLPKANQIYQSSPQKYGLGETL
ncbi:MAG: M48 family metallopeptidase [Nitrospinales bacterium]